MCLLNAQTLTEMEDKNLELTPEVYIEVLNILSRSGHGNQVEEILSHMRDTDLLLSG